MLERLEAKIDYLAAKMAEHEDRAQQDIADLKVGVARLEEKVSFHSKGLSAVGATIIAAVSAIFTQILWKFFKSS